MKTVFKKGYSGLVFNSIILISLLLTISNSLSYTKFNNEVDFDEALRNREELIFTQDPNNDTIAPVIILIQPENNNTIIRIKSYNIIANITDENPPVFGNVTLQISNFTHSLFNASMNFDGGDQWSFSWDNISLYPNKFYRGYIIQITAIDSSSDYNIGMSEKIYIYLNVHGDSPGVLNIFLYLIIVCLLFAGIVVYLNRKILRKVTGKNSEDDKGVYEY
ncbi:MAG: hypothetical protein ACFFE5_03100 [Candidatus Thorarchaeota archaeon]